MTATWKQPFPELWFTATQAATAALFSVVELVIPRGKVFVLDWWSPSAASTVRVIPSPTTLITANLATVQQTISHPAGVQLLGRTGTRADIGLLGILQTVSFPQPFPVSHILLDGNDTGFLSFIHQTANTAHTISLHGLLCDAGADLERLLSL